MNIFIVNNHQMLIDGLLALFVQMKNFNVIGSCNSLHEVLDEDKFLKADLLLVDEYENIEIIKKIKKRKKNLKVLSLAICNDLNKIRTLYHMGIDGFMEDTVGFPQLIDAMKKIEVGELFMSDCLKKTVFASFTNNGPQVDNLKIEEKIETLTKREIEVMKSICSGLKSKEISDRLFISPNTVETHRRNIFHKLDINNSISLVKLALENNIVTY